MGKHLGQHLLVSKKIVDKIVDTSLLDNNKCDFVLEIGPGRGALTEKLLEEYKKVVCVEKDKNFYGYLEKKFENEIKKKKLVLFLSDIRDFNLTKSFGEDKKYKVVANIPYYITGSIIKDFLSKEKKPTSMTLLVQKEVAERIAKSKKESILSLSVKFFGSPLYICTVKKNVFSPQPKVDSAILYIKDIKDQEKIFEKHFFQIIKKAFSAKRKKISSLLDKETCDLLVSVGISKDKRAEDVDILAWEKLIKEKGAYLLCEKKSTGKTGRGKRNGG